MTTQALPIRRGTTSSEVRDLTSRLQGLGYSVDPDLSHFGRATEHAVREFQRSRGLDPTGVCDQQTWTCLVEAGFGLGDRLIYLTAPMLRGDDVAELQLRLGALGFDAGRVDGIFGTATQQALSEFQHNVGVVVDSVCGPETIDALRRLHSRGGSTTVAGARERHELRSISQTLRQLRVALVHDGSAELLVGALGAALHQIGATVGVFADADPPELAQMVNAFDAQLCLALESTSRPSCEIAFFETPGFSSAGGRRLAELCIRELPRTPAWPVGRTQGMRLAILRETRPPTVAVRLGPDQQVLELHRLVASALTRAVSAWVASPV